YTVSTLEGSELEDAVSAASHQEAVRLLDLNRAVYHVRFWSTEGEQEQTELFIQADALMFGNGDYLRLSRDGGIHLMENLEGDGYVFGQGGDGNDRIYGS